MNTLIQPTRPIPAHATLASLPARHFSRGGEGQSRRNCGVLSILRTLLLMLAILAPCLAQAQPLVSNVRAAQRPGSNLVDIYYDLSGYGGYLPPSISVEISSDGGATHTIPATSLTGDVGPSVMPGSNRRISWNAGADWIDQFSTAMRVKISATIRVADMTRIPEGYFAMGDALNEGAFDTLGLYGDELPVHTVLVSTFYMDKFEVTKALWEEVADWAAENGYDIYWVDAAGKGPNYPVADVSWDEALKWCNARSQREGLTPCYSIDGAIYKTKTQLLSSVTGVVFNFSASGYRLPTEAEWEKAARGGLANKRFPWGDTITHDHANYQSFSGTPAAMYYDVSPTTGYHPSFVTEDYFYTSPVGSFAPNGYGLYDMAGNVAEWCWDEYSHNYYESSATWNPLGPAFTSWTRKDGVLRGGSWQDDPRSLRVADRQPWGSPFGMIGFRCVRNSVP